MEIVTDPNRILVRTERFRALGALQDGTPEIGEVVPDRFDFRCYAIRNLPPRWAPWDPVRLIGDPYIDKLRTPCQIATLPTFYYPDEQPATAKAGVQFMRSTNLSNSSSEERRVRKAGVSKCKTRRSPYK